MSQTVNHNPPIVPHRPGIALAALALAMVLATAAQAIVVPAGLNRGDQYRLAFVTEGLRNAVSSDIAVYNQFVNDQAALSTLTSGVNWFAIGSTDTVDARDNTMTNPFVDGVGVPIYLVDGTTVIAVDNSDLWDGDIGPSLRLTQHGVTPAGINVWTGTDTDGTSLGPVSLGGGPVRSGFSDGGTTVWVSAQFDPADTQFSIYAMSDVLTIPAPPVPEPITATLGLMSLAAGLGYTTKRRRLS